MDIFSMKLGKIYTLLVSKAERKGRTKEEVNALIFSLMGYNEASLEKAISDDISYGEFFRNAPSFDPGWINVKGSICSVRIENIGDELMRKVRVLEKRVDLDSVRSKAPVVRSLSGDLTASDAKSAISALASLLHPASDSLGGIDPDHTERSLAGLGGSSYTRGLVEKYGDPGHMAVWSYLELASIGGVISLYKYYVFERRAMKDEEAVKGLLFPTKALRNAAAHNGNMLSALGSKLRKSVGSISRMAVEGLGIDREPVSLTKRAPIVHDFTALTLCYMHLVKSEDARRDAAEKLRALRRRFMAHRGYFSKQGELKNGLAMLSEVMDRATGRLSRP